MATLQFDVDLFRAQFPGLFPDPPNTDALIETMWGAAICYVSPNTAGPLSADCRRQVLNLVTAHLISLLDSAAAGNQPGFVVSAGIDKISVSIQAPPSRNEFQFFLNQTLYGIQAYAMLYAAGAGGSYLGGFNELGSYRRAGGVFVPPTQIASVEAADLTCDILTVPPPDLSGLIDIGIVLTTAANTNQFLFPSGCEQLIIGWATINAGADVGGFIFSGLPIDSGDRFNFYYWSGDDRIAGGQATKMFFGVDITGASFIDGFFAEDMFSGSLGSEPNIFVITGVSTTDTLPCNFNLVAS